MLKKLAILPFLLLWCNSIYSVMADQPFLEKALPENRLFIDFINISVSNFGSQEHLDYLETAYKHDYNANLFFLKGEYTNSHRELLLCQKALRDLYYNMLMNVYIVDTDKLLEMSAPVIMLAKDNKAAYYLSYGYRHLAKAKQFGVRGYNYNKFLYSNKIRFYMNAILHIRQAKKYALLALIESKTPIVDKDSYRLQSINEAKGVIPRTRISLYKKIKYGIMDNIQRKTLPPNFPFLLHHDDNYGYIYGDKKSALSAIVQKNADQLPANQPGNTPTTTPANTAP